MTPAAAPPPALVVVCRRPRDGHGKQRLAAALGMAPAREVAELLLATALEDAVTWPGPVVLAPADPTDRAWAAALLPREVIVIPQPPGNLGERLLEVDRAARAAGMKTLIYIGSDAPVLHEGVYRAAREALGRCDVVIASALDGGVTLMGARAPWPDLAALPWSTADLGSALGNCCRQAGLTVEVLDGGYDVDLPADLRRLQADLAADPRPARQRLHRWLLARDACGTLPP